MRSLFIPRATVDSNHYLICWHLPGLLLPGLIFLAGVLTLTACTGSRNPLGRATSTLIDKPASITPAPATSTPQPTSTPTKTATVTPATIPTHTPTPTWTPFPRSMEAYGMVYDPLATAEIPPRRSISMMIWGTAFPATPVAATPQFTSFPPPSGMAKVSSQALVKAGCEITDRWGSTFCASDSPLQSLPCDEIAIPQWLYLDPETSRSFVGSCRVATEAWETSEVDALYIVGCAFRRTVGFIFQNQGEYVLLSTPDELRSFFTPIGTPDKALSYAQLMTGLHPAFDLSLDPTLLYFRDPIEATHVTETSSGFIVNLFHSRGCFCEPWENSEIILDLGRDGSLVWKQANLLSITTGFGCAD